MCDTPDAALNMYRLLIKMIWLFILLTLSPITTTVLEIVEPDPSSGIVLKKQPGLLITNYDLHACKKNFPNAKDKLSWVGRFCNNNTINHAKADTSHMLQKFTITQVEIPDIRAQINRPQCELQTIGKTVQSISPVVNAHSETLNQTMHAVNSLRSAINVDNAHAQLVSMLMTDMLCEITPSVNSLAMGKIPPHLIPSSLVHHNLTTTTRDIVIPLQAHPAHTLTSVVAIHVDPEEREVALYP